MTNFTTQQICDRVAGRLDGPGDVAITGVEQIDRATAGQVTFIGAPQFGDPNNVGTGYIRVISGDLGYATLMTLKGENVGDVFGAAVAGADMDGDGYDDLIMGDPYTSSYRGTVYVQHGPVSGSIGAASVDASIVESAANYLGRRVGAFDDSTVLIGALYDDEVDTYSGAVYLFEDPTSTGLALADADAHVLSYSDRAAMAIGFDTSRSSTSAATPPGPSTCSSGATRCQTKRKRMKSAADTGSMA